LQENSLKKEKLLVFHPALAPYRVDFFNALDDRFKLQLFFESNNLREQELDQKLLHQKLTCRPYFIKRGFLLGGRFISLEYFHILSKVNPDIIVSSEYGLATICAAIWNYLLGGKRRLYLMCDDNHLLIKNKGKVKVAIRYLISKMITGVILPSAEVASLYKSSVSRTNKVLILPIIHDEVTFSTMLSKSVEVARDNVRLNGLDNKRIILFVGRLVVEKNIEILIKAFERAALSDAKLVIVGDGPDYARLNNLVVDLGIENNLLFVGKKEGPALVSWYVAAGLFVLPSTHEPFGAVVNEALIAGCAVLCSNRAGARTLIDENNGHIFNPYSIEELSLLLQKFAPDQVNVSSLAMKKNKMPMKFMQVLDDLYKLV
jgi:glycosyltransferase involved in cell wall biosynthesis